MKYEDLDSKLNRVEMKNMAHWVRIDENDVTDEWVCLVIFTKSSSSLN